MASTKRAKSPASHGGPPADEVVGRAFDRRLMSRLLRYALPYRWQMAQVVALIVLVTVLGVAGPIIFMKAIDGPLAAAIAGKDAASSTAVADLLKLVGIFVVISAALIGLRFLESYSMARIGQKIMLDLRLELFEHLQRMPLAFYDRNPVGRLVTRITSDVEALNELFASGVVTFLADIMVLVGITITLLYVNISLA